MPLVLPTQEGSRLQYYLQDSPRSCLPSTAKGRLPSRPEGLPVTGPSGWGFRDHALRGSEVGFSVRERGRGREVGELSQGTNGATSAPRHETGRRMRSTAGTQRRNPAPRHVATPP